MELNKLYFYTATILNWKQLLSFDTYKDYIINSLKYLVDEKKIALYGFVIMPNHIHLIWELLELNGKELPHASFMKYTSHLILKDLQINNPELLKEFNVDLETRNYQFWQRDALPVHLYTPEVIYQKLDYIHNNPLQEKWMLVDLPADYKYSSAYFYENEQDDFGMLTHINEKL